MKRAAPGCVQDYFDEHQTFVALSARKGEEWGSVVVEAAKAAPALRDLTVAELRRSVLPISRRDAFDVAKLISVGSLLWGVPDSIRHPDPQLDDCLLSLLHAVGEDAEYFTNHGQAEEDGEGDFLLPSSHFTCLAETTIDVCLIGVSDSRVLILWRFEDD